MTSLAEVQRAFTRICFDHEPQAADLALLHDDASRWLMYRRMVRSRLFKMMRNGLPKTAALLGPTRFDAAISDYLAEHAPQTRFIREVVNELVDHALPGWAQDEALPHLADLARYEALKWRVGALEWPTTAPVADELDFEGRPVLNPTVRDLTVRFRVDKDWRSPSRLDGAHRVLVHQKPGSNRVYTYVLNPMGGQLFDAWRESESFAEGARHVLAANERAPDARFIDGMAGVLADMVEQSIFLGSARAPASQSAGPPDPSAPGPDR